MKITIVQPDLAWCDPAANREHLTEMIRGALAVAVRASDKATSEETDNALSPNEPNGDSAPDAFVSGEPGLIVIPEMFSTGFATDPVGVAEENGESLEWMKSMAASTGCAIAGSIATKITDLGEGQAACSRHETSRKAVQIGPEDRVKTIVEAKSSIPSKPSYRNRFYFVKPGGDVAYYDKHHPFTYSGEHLRYTPGQGKTIVEWGGFKIMLQVCYDLRFPCFSRNCLDAGGNAAYDLCLYVASWPRTRAGAWKTLLRARAIENQCYVVGVNRVGSDPSCRYSGDSAIIDPYGDTLAACTPSAESTATAIASLHTLNDFRAKFPVLADAD